MERTISIVNLLQDEAEMLPLVVPSYASLRPPRLKEWVVVDDGSTDNSRQVAEELAHEFGLPLIWICNKMTSWSVQRNLGIELCSGDFILNLDADMAFTGNLASLLDQGYFDSNDVWDFYVYYMRQDMHHYCVRSSTGYSTRMIKNCGIRYRYDAHEQPEAIKAGPVKTTLPHNANGIAKAYCPHVAILECSLLGSDEALLRRGRRVQVWYEALKARGLPPGDDYRYVNAKHSSHPIAPLHEQFRNAIVTLEDARRHGWGLPHV